MRNTLIILFSCLILVSCKDKDQETNKELVYDMYEPSEMALLMQEMYTINERIKQDILEGKTPEKFPEEFLKIHTAELSEFKARNETFETFSKMFLEKEQDVFKSLSNDDAKEHYNQAINLCISCHQTECTGPIPRIKKLLIK